MNIVINKKEYEIPTNIIIGICLVIPFIVFILFLAILVNLFWIAIGVIVFIILLIVALFGLSIILD